MREFAKNVVVAVAIALFLALTLAVGLASRYVEYRISRSIDGMVRP